MKQSDLAAWGVTIHCLADDARTVVAPFKRVSSLETLYRLRERAQLILYSRRRVCKWIDT